MLPLYQHPDMQLPSAAEDQRWDPQPSQEDYKQSFRQFIKELSIKDRILFYVENRLFKPGLPF